MKTILYASIVNLLVSVPMFAQGETALPFLLISPAAVSNGMGETSVALTRDDPLAALSNPAHLGIFSRTNTFSAGYDRADWLPQFQQSDLTFTTFGFNGGLNLQRQFGIAPELSVGVAYSRIRLNLGTFNETSDQGPEVISTFEAFETADHYSIGVGFNYWISVAAGYTLKQVNSNLAPFEVQGQSRKGRAEISTYDFGLLFSVPVFDIVGRLRETPVVISQELRPVLGLHAGLAKNNLGDKRVVYIDPAQADPLPRVARLGVGLELGFALSRDEFEWRPVMFSWTRESNDVLVRRYPAPTDSLGNPTGDPPPPDYRGGFGDIRFVDDLFLGKENPHADVKTGLQLDFAEVLSVRIGRYIEPPDEGNRRFSTSGYTVRLGGVVKILRLLDVSFGPEGFVRSLITHLDLRYTHSELNTYEPNHPLDETEFSSWTLVLSSWNP